MTMKRKAVMENGDQVRKHRCEHHAQGHGSCVLYTFKLQLKIKTWFGT